MIMLPPAPQIRILASSAVAVPFTGSTSETAIVTVSVPANSMGLNGRLRVTTLWSYTNSANSKSLRVRFGGIGGTAYFSQPNTTTATQRAQTEIQNRNSASSQVGCVPSAAAQWAASSVAVVTSAVDTTAAVDLVISGQLASSGETITLESYLVELIVPN